MLEWMHQPIKLKILSCWEKLGNPLIHFTPNTEEELKLDYFAITMTNHLGGWRRWEMPSFFLS
jgi:hypothetical protein